MNIAQYQRTQGLVKYLDMADKLHEDAEAVLDHRLTEEQAVQMYKADDAHYIKDKIKHLKLQREFYIEEQNYLRAVRYVLVNGWTRNQAAVECRVSIHVLKKEIRKARKMRSIDLYFFNRRINYIFGDTWTYRDDKAVLDRLREWRDSGEELRFGQLTIYEKISELAYQYVIARGTNLPRAWMMYQQPTFRWLKHFAMRHHDEIREMFRYVQVQEYDILSLL